MYLKHILTCLPFNIATISMFLQNDYMTDIEYLTVDYCNPHSMGLYDMKLVRPNRTFKALSLRCKFLFDINGDTFKINLKMYRVVNNLPVVLLLQFDVRACDCLKAKGFGIEEILQVGNFTKCPIKKGYYVMENFNIDYRRFPPNVPGGRYKIIASIMFKGDTLARISFIGSIIYKVKQG